MQGFDAFGKYVMLAGALLLVIGAVMILGPKIPFLGKLPGDINIRRENFRFYFPIVTCIIISAIISLALTLPNKFR